MKIILLISIIRLLYYTSYIITLNTDFSNTILRKILSILHYFYSFVIKKCRKNFSQKNIDFQRKIV